ncbi:vacuolar protein sorting-associated protein 26A-like [Cucumis melo var. makuwa]|uniref:Vacuolar protein sorting-associated protein 26A-like n=1 Tax=Cucumis melo var. makuwa TaxID=1194695 RepID=A0A5D3CX27_CUCMM|nr:vacuolar protein sorting-associated protein 26A-like [Cucumis melo var. makuwa]TYK16025.1 vacuolar protein sorting-associated protein 26A-like [Cucumis melo var. makuwa]
MGLTNTITDRGLKRLSHRHPPAGQPHVCGLGINQTYRRAVFEVGASLSQTDLPMYSKNSNSERIDVRETASTSQSTIPTTSQTSSPTLSAIAQSGMSQSLGLISVDGKNPWILDSGATDHLTGFSEHFVSYTPCVGNEKIQIVDDSLAPIAGKGQIVLFDAIFLPESICFQDLSLGRMIGTARPSRGLYILNDDTSDSSIYTTSLLSFYFSTSEHDFMLWHFLLAYKGIFHQNSCAYTPQQNGVVKRKNRHLLEVARSLMLSTFLPSYLWGDAILTAVHLINRMPSHILHLQNPLECLKESYPFTCLVSERGYKCFHPSSRKYFVTMDVTFCEDRPYFPVSHLQGESVSEESNITIEFIEPTPSTVSDIDPHPIILPTNQVPWKTYYRRNLKKEVGSSISQQPAPVQDFEPPRDQGMKNPTEPCTNNTMNEDDNSDVVLENVEEKNSGDETEVRTETSNNEAEQVIQENLTKCPEWKNVVMEEMKALEKNNTWEIFSLPKGHKPVGCKWVFTLKYKVDRTLDRHKTRVILSVAVNKDWPLYQLDVKNAFLNGDLVEEIIKQKSVNLSGEWRKYTLDLLTETGALGCRPADTPIEFNCKLGNSDDQVPVDKEQYHRLLGKLIYLSHTRPDISFADLLLTESLPLVMCTFVWGNLVTWSILSDLHQECETPLKLFCDNKAAISIANNPVQNDRTKHVEIDRYFIKEKLDSGSICFPYILSSRQNYLLGAFKPSCNVSIAFSDGKTRKQVPLKKENGQTVLVPLFQSQENITGKITIDPLQGKKVDHNGVKIELLGQIEMYFDRGNFYDFTSLVRELDVPGEIYERKTYPFEFSTVEMPYETYNGVNVRLRYVLKVTISRGYAGSIVEYQDFVVRNYSPLPSINNGIKMEVGIEDCLHIEFEYNKSKYHLKDVIIGKIYFLLVRIKIKNMDLEIRRRESTGSGANTHVETETLAKYELMDGAPVRGESIPVRLFLSPYELTPTHRNINNKFSVKYYLNLVLVDEEDRRYFKQQEITIYRLQETT